MGIHNCKKSVLLNLEYYIKWKRWISETLLLLTWPLCTEHLQMTNPTNLQNDFLLQNVFPNFKERKMNFWHPIYLKYDHCAPDIYKWPAQPLCASQTPGGPLDKVLIYKSRGRLFLLCTPTIRLFWHFLKQTFTLFSLVS